MLRYVNSTRAPQRAHEVLQELRDISSMAMEYFDEKIVPILKKKLPGADLSGRLIGSAPGNGNVRKVRSLQKETGPWAPYLKCNIESVVIVGSWLSSASVLNQNKYLCFTDSSQTQRREGSFTHFLL